VFIKRDGNGTLIEVAAAGRRERLHLEAGMPTGGAVRGALRSKANRFPTHRTLRRRQPVDLRHAMPGFLERRSYETSRTIRGVRAESMFCRLSAASAWTIRTAAFLSRPDLEKH